ncbi:MAG: phage shock protein operon transcriptional activator [Desulfobacterales bacterium]|nr:phage shock protein operon transcriptional activator [Desulfobacterales bacterium]
MDEALGQSDVFLEFQERLSQVAPIDRPVLILGERGTGKELAAARLHYLSHRWQRPFITLNCAALSPSLLEPELFGFEKGAFTGAMQRRRGRFEAADSGTLFLDEIGNLPMVVQEKILRVVEYHTFERVGSSDTIEVDVRIVAATNVNLLALATQKKFKQDLLDRLSFEVLNIPPLRKRLGDIALLAHHFATRMAFELGRTEIPVISSDAMAALENHLWPGNVRELKNVVERAVYRADTNEIQQIVFDPFHSPFGVESPASLRAKNNSPTFDSDPKFENLMQQPLKDAVWLLKSRMLENALRQTQFHQKKAAQRLGLTYHQFRGLYRQYQNRSRKD